MLLAFRWKFLHNLVAILNFGHCMVATLASWYSLCASIIKLLNTLKSSYPKIHDKPRFRPQIRLSSFFCVKVYQRLCANINILWWPFWIYVAAKAFCHKTIDIIGVIIPQNLGLDTKYFFLTLLR